MPPALFPAYNTCNILSITVLKEVAPVSGRCIDKNELAVYIIKKEIDDPL
jgi:hypothetical protein